MLEISSVCVVGKIFYLWPGLPSWMLLFLTTQGRHLTVDVIQFSPDEGMTEDGITENAITLFFGRAGRWHNQKTL
jgi:hypothetical protein